MSQSRYDRPTARPSKAASASYWITTAMTAALVLVLLYLLVPMALAQLQGSPPVPAVRTLPTAAISAPAAAPIQLNNPAQNGGNVAPPACAFPLLNGVCGNGQPAVQPVQDAPQAPEQGRAIVEPVATPEPLVTVPVPSGAIANPGAGQCLHGQVFTSAGCKNPNGRGSRHGGNDGRAK